MAETAFATTDPEKKAAWDEQFYRDTKKESYFSRFMGKDSASLVNEKTDLEKDQGDEIKFFIRRRLQGDGITSSGTLEGNEEALDTDDDYVRLEEYAHAVKDKGPIHRQRVFFSIDSESKLALKDWGAEKIDSLCFDAVLNSPTKIFYKDASKTLNGTATAATAKAALTTANGKLTTSMISALATWAKTGGGRASGMVPIRPIKIGKDSLYVLLVHPDVLYDLKVDSTFQGAMQYARERGPDNPLFKDATAIWGNVVIHEHENIPIDDDAGSGGNVPWAQCVFMGAQALLFAWGVRPQVVARDFDYGRKHGFAWSVICGAKKPVFDSVDFGSVGVYLARTPISDE